MNETMKAPESKRSVLYILPIPRFYSQIGGVGGHVAHANGVMKSLDGLGVALDVLAEEQPTDPMSFVKTWHTLPCSNTHLIGRYAWGQKLVSFVGEIVPQTKYSFCYVRYSTQFAPLVPALKKALGTIPLVLELNSFASQRGAFSRTFLSSTEKRALAISDLVVCVSDPLKNDVMSFLGAAAGQNCLVVPNGVDSDRFLPVFKTPDSKGSSINLCYCGVLKNGYGLDQLLATHKKLEAKYPRLALHIIGDGPSRDSLENSPNKGSNVIFHGAVGFNDVPSKLAAMDILIYTTSTGNTFQSPIKLYEYMCTGRPVVAANTPQVQEVFQGKEQCGLLFEVDSPSHLYDSIECLLTDPEAGMARAKHARKVVESSHHWDQRVARIQRALKDRGLIHD